MELYLLLSIVLSTISLYIIYFLGQGEGPIIITGIVIGIIIRILFVLNSINKKLKNSIPTVIEKKKKKKINIGLKSIVKRNSVRSKLCL